MLNSKLLDYIIIALLIIVMINIFSQMFDLKCNNNNKSAEGMNSMEQSNVSDKILPTDGLDIGAPLTSNNLTNQNVTDMVAPLQAQINSSSSSSQFAPSNYSSIGYNMNTISSSKSTDSAYSVKSEQAVNKLIQLQQQNQDLSKTCPIKGTPYENDRYIKEFVLGGKFNCADKMPDKKFTRREILQYQNSMFDFNDQLFESTSNNIDTVDQINELMTSGNKTIVDGQTISSVFDGLTQTQLDKKKKCINPSCLIPPQIDMTSKDASYIGNTDVGKYYRHGLMYEDDDVNTGAKFYENIEAMDSEFEDKLIWHP